MKTVTELAQQIADQELEACVGEMRDMEGDSVADDLLAARRPKPPSLKEQALALVDNLLICDHLAPSDESILRRALEALPE